MNLLKVAIIEDEDLLRNGLTGCIDWHSLGYELAGAAEDGEKGITLIERVSPDVVITDVRMPRMDGLELSDWIGKNRPNIKVVIISGYDDFEYARRALKAGVYEYVLKPLNLEQLKDVVQKAAEELLKEQEYAEEITKLKDISRESIDTIRQTVYSNILFHGSIKKELGQGACEIAEQLDSKYYAAGILEQSDFPILSIDRDYLEIMEMDQKFEMQINKRLGKLMHSEEGKHVDVLRSNNGERVLCVCYDTREEVKALVGRLEQIFDANHEEIENVEISCGQAQGGLGGLEKSYLRARKVSEKSFMKNWGQILHTKGQASSTIQYMNYDAQALFFEIRSGKKTGIENCLEEFEEGLNRENIVSYMQIVMIVSNLFFELIKLPEEVGGKAEEIIGNCMDAYHRIIEKRKRHEMVEELKEVCLAIHNYFDSVSGGKMQGVIKRIKAYIELHYAEENLSMKDVAEYAYISVSYLSIILKKETGQTFIEYLTEIRIQKAKDFLVNTNMKNYEVAIACGYSTPAYFSTVFKGVCGMSPSAYRSEMQN